MVFSRESIDSALFELDETTEITSQRFLEEIQKKTDLNQDFLVLQSCFEDCRKAIIFFKLKYDISRRLSHYEFNDMAFSFLSQGQDIEILPSHCLKTFTWEVWPFFPLEGLLRRRREFFALSQQVGNYDSHVLQLNGPKRFSKWRKESPFLETGRKKAESF